MLYILFSIIFLLPVLLGWGQLFQYIIQPFKNQLSSLLLIGIVGSVLFFTTISFFLALNFYAEIIYLGIGFFSFFLFKIHKKLFHFIYNVGREFYIIVAIILFSGSFYPFILDHFGYYIPTINWLKSFGLTKGIGNIDLTLSQMSLWHIFQAGISHFSDAFFRINAIFSIIYLVYIFEKKSWVQLCFLPILFFFLQSPSPDLPVTVFSLIILNEIFTGNQRFSSLLFIAIFVFAIKPTMLWLPLFIFLLFCFEFTKSLKFGTKSFKNILLSLIFLSLFFLKNSWAFGFPIFPVQVLDLNLPWKPNPDVLQTSSEIAILKTYDMQYNLSEIQEFTILDYAKNWLSLSGIKVVIHWVFILSLLSFFILIVNKKDKKLNLLFISVLVKSILVLLFSAQYRFFIDVFFVVFFVFFYQKISRKMSVIIFYTFSFFVLSTFSFPNLLQKAVPSFRLGYFMNGFQYKQIVQPSSYQLKKYKKYSFNGLPFFVVQNYPFIFDTPPLTFSKSDLEQFYELKIFPQKIGKKIKQGFVWKNLTEQELLELKKIIDDQEN